MYLLQAAIYLGQDNYSTSNINLTVETIENDVKKLLSVYYGNTSKLNSNTTIQSLGIISEELDEFFEKYFKRFNIDPTSYNYYDYFLEQVNTLVVIRDVFYRIFKSEKIRRRKLTIAHLIKVAEHGKWIIPDDGLV